MSNLGSRWGDLPISKHVRLSEEDDARIKEEAKIDRAQYSVTMRTLIREALETRANLRLAEEMLQANAEPVEAVDWYE